MGFTVLCFSRMMLLSTFESMTHFFLPKERFLRCVLSLSIEYTSFPDA